MRINRRFLYWGLVLVAVGGVLVAADVGAVDTAVLADALRLWPLAVVAIGLSLVLRRSQFALPALIAAALVPGLVVGAAFAVAPRFAGNCGAQSALQDVTTIDGTFDEPAVVAVRTGCGELTVSTAAGNDWRLHARSTAGSAPNVESSGRQLSIDVPGGRMIPFDFGRDAWDLTLPTSALRQLSVTAFAADAQVDLPDAEIGHLSLTANAASIVADASDAEIAELTGEVNIGSLSIRLPSSDLTGALRVGAGDLRICAPPELGLSITSRGSAERITVNGVEQTASEWRSPGYASATHRADLSLTTNLGAVEINPIGGCS